LPKAWSALLKEQDSLLLDLLAEKVEDLCGYKPDVDVCSQFLERQGQASQYVTNSIPVKSAPIIQQKNFTSGNGISRTRIVDNFKFIFKGEEIAAGSAREVMTTIFQLLAKEDGGFLDRFASRKHGKKKEIPCKR